MGIEKYDTLSSGRWDASGSWADAVFHEKKKAFHWAEGLSLEQLIKALEILAVDINAEFSTYERQAVLYRILDELRINYENN